jgi:hypothetical protein
LLNAVKECKLNPLIHICSSSEIFGKVKKNRPVLNQNKFDHAGVFIFFQPPSPTCHSK